MSNSTKITRQDLEDQFRTLQEDVTKKVDDKKADPKKDKKLESNPKGGAKKKKE